MKYRGIGLLAALATTLFLSTAVAWSQESAASIPFRTCLFPAVDLSASEEYKEYQSIISSQLRAELNNAGFDIIPREEWEAARDRRGIRMSDLYR